MAGSLRFTHIGGATALIEYSGLRFLTDPTFDGAGTEFRSGSYALERTSGPALSADAVLPLDAVLLSHDHHFDNLDDAGRRLLPRAARVLTTQAGASRLGENAIGLDHWQSHAIPAPFGHQVLVTATPARHGPAGGDRGPVIGFLLTSTIPDAAAIYISGDTVWYDGVEEIARRFHVDYAFLFMGAARVPSVGPQHLTLTAEEGVRLAQALPEAIILPLHFEGWRHFSEDREAIEKAFRHAGIGRRLVWGQPGIGLELNPPLLRASPV